MRKLADVQARRGLRVRERNVLPAASSKSLSSLMAAIQENQESTENEPAMETGAEVAV